jgi:uncharacterized protein (DUF1778 family)
MCGYLPYTGNCDGKREHEVLTLNARAKRVFVEALLNPPKPNAKAIAAARRLKEETS